MTIKTKWVEFFYIIATSSRKVRNFYTPIGAFIYSFLVFSFVVVALRVDGFFGFTPIVSKPFHIILSLPVFLVALFLIGWSVFNFFKAKGTPVPFNPPPQLVTTGPYAFTRNPMLTGVFSLLLGFGIFFGSVFLLFVFIPLFILVNFWELKSIEEPELEKRLGDEYIAYRKATPMFFPALKNIFKRL